MIYKIIVIDDEGIVRTIPYHDIEVVNDTLVNDEVFYDFEVLVKNYLCARGVAKSFTRIPRPRK